MHIILSASLITDDNTVALSHGTDIIRNNHLLRVVVVVEVVRSGTSTVVMGFSAVNCGVFGMVGFEVVVIVDVGFSVGDCGFAIVEQAFSPSLQVCSNLVSPGCPHFPRQDPPLPQQVSAPLLPRPHLGHTVKL